MKKIFVIAIALAFSAGCDAQGNPKIPSNVPVKETKSVTCYSGSSVTYENNNVILTVHINDKDISARIQEVDTGVSRRVPISQCYFKDN